MVKQGIIYFLPIVVAKLGLKLNETFLSVEKEEYFVVRTQNNKNQNTRSFG